MDQNKTHISFTFKLGANANIDDEFDYQVYKLPLVKEREKEILDPFEMQIDLIYSFKLKRKNRSAEERNCFKIISIQKE